MSTQQSNTERRQSKGADEWDTYNLWTRRKRRELLCGMNRKSHKEIKKRTHKRERQDYKQLIKEEQA